MKWEMGKSCTVQGISNPFQGIIGLRMHHIPSCSSHFADFFSRDKQANGKVQKSTSYTLYVSVTAYKNIKI